MVSDFQHPYKSTITRERSDLSPSDLMPFSIKVFWLTYHHRKSGIPFQPPFINLEKPNLFTLTKEISFSLPVIYIMLFFEPLQLCDISKFHQHAPSYFLRQKELNMVNSKVILEEPLYTKSQNLFESSLNKECMNAKFLLVNQLLLSR